MEGISEGTGGSVTGYYDTRGMGCCIDIDEDRRDSLGWQRWWLNGPCPHTREGKDNAYTDSEM